MPYRAPEVDDRPGETHSISPRAILMLLMALAALCHFNRVSISVAGSERLMTEFSLNEQQLGWIYSAYLIVYTLLMLPGGWLLDRFGPRRMMGAMAAGSAVFVGMTALAGLPIVPLGAFASLLLVRGALGAASVPMHPGAANTVANWIAPAKRASANARVTAAALVGIALSYPLFGELIDTVGWRIGMLISAAVTGAVALAWSIIARDRPASTTNIPDAAAWDSPAAAPVAARIEPPTLPAAELRITSLLLLTASYAAVGYFQYLFWTAVVEVAGNRRGMAAASFNTGGNVGGLLAPYATPVISAWLGWQSGIALASLFCLVGAALWLWVRPAEAA